MSRGFTIVEVLITLVAMVILLTLGTIAVSGFLKNARDTERKEDIAAIARGLERRYTQGNTRLPSGDGKGSYPAVNEFRHMKGTSITGFNPAQVSGGYLTQALNGTSDSTFLNPSGANQFVLECESSCAAAGNAAQLTAVFTNNSDPYVYSPKDINGNVCTTAPCVSFTLYWKSEATGTRHKVESLHR